MKIRGVVASGHETTTHAALELLRVGGNAFDAALGALFAACVAEPVLASLGGGGFLLARPMDANPLLYDFFTQTPIQRLPETGLDFRPILANFGAAQQEFHIGMGAIATPGMVPGLFAIHAERCRLPLREIMAPALEAARDGVRVNALQHYIAEIVAPIIRSSDAACRLHGAADTRAPFAAEGDHLTQQDMADGLEQLLSEGERLMRDGDWAQRLARDCHEQGGYLQLRDLQDYRVIKRAPLQLRYRDTDVFTNPAPSLGGTLIAFGLSLLEAVPLGSHHAGGAEHLLLLAEAMQQTQQLRRSEAFEEAMQREQSHTLLSEEHLAAYRRSLQEHPCCSRGTTQISVADAEGNLASMTLSNGEGSGYVLPGTGIMLNNMLGEEDINPHGFHAWQPDRRLASMMSPSLLLNRERDIVLGSGGSNRIRSAVLQVMLNLLDFGMSLEEAVNFPRIHLEGKLLNIEAGPGCLEQLCARFPEHHLWTEPNLFFGGVHSVMRSHQGLEGAADPRRGGQCGTA